MELKDYIEAALGILFIGIGGMAMGWFKILKETNSLLKEQNKELKDDNKSWQEKHIENERAIANLQGQLDTLKDIPLRHIDTSLSEISQSNKQILQTLVQSATVLQENTKITAKRVRKVRTDLAESEA